MNCKHLTLSLKTYIAILLTVYTLASLAIPPAMYSDPGWGFAVLRSMNNGASFNCILSPNPGDISTQFSHFFSWWTPGQYIIPGILIKLGISHGKAITIVTAVFSCIGIIGWNKVYQKLGFSELLSWLCCAFIVSQRYIALPFNIYTGGEILIFGASPYVMLCVLNWKRPGILHCFALIILFEVLFFLKNSGLIFAMALCLAIPLLRLRTDSFRDYVKQAIIYGFTFAVSSCIAYFAYIANSPYAKLAKEASVVEKTLPNTLFAFSGPFMSSISFDDLLNRLISNPNHVIIQKWPSHLSIIIPISIASLLVYYFVMHFYMNTEYGTILAGLLFVYIIVFFVINVFSHAVTSSTEARHFRLCGLILLPGILSLLFSNAQRVWRYGLTLFIIAVSLYGVSSFFVRTVFNVKKATIGIQNFTQINLDKDDLNWLIQMGKTTNPSTTVFYLTTPELSLEIPRAHIIVTHADFESTQLLASRVYHGRVENLFVLLPKSFAENGKSKIITSSFVDYSDWKHKQMGSSIIYFPSSNTIQP